jgi:hypothetical protein
MMDTRVKPAYDQWEVADCSAGAVAGRALARPGGSAMTEIFWGYFIAS